MTAIQCDILGGFGLAMVAGGLWWIAPPLSVVAIGLGMVITAALLARRPTRDTR